MTATTVVVVVLWCAVTAYAVLGGADFGAGIWDLTAGGPEKGATRRDLIDRSIGPIWETNHVWLIFVLVVLWTCFSVAFASIMSTLYIPLTLVMIGVVLRGSGYAFRHTAVTLRSRRLFGILFAASSVITPFFLGTVAGAVASGRVPVGNASGAPIRSWLNPTSLLGGTLAVVTCAFLAAVFLTHEAERRHGGDHQLVDEFRARAFGAAVVTGIVAIGGIFVLRADAPVLFEGLIGVAAPLVLLSALGGGAALVLLATRHFVWARIAAVVAVGSVIWGWGAAQYPVMLEPSLTIDDAAAPAATMTAVAIVASVGLVILLPALVLLFSLSENEFLDEDHETLEPPAPTAGRAGPAPEPGPRPAR